MPVWIDKAVVLAIHDAQISEHGGLPRIRDEGALDSALARPQNALARPQNLAAYGRPTLHDLAAAYGFGLARNHTFSDGNKRVAAVVTELFLDLNGVELTASDVSFVATWLDIAAGTLDEAAISAWLASHSSERA